MTSIELDKQQSIIFDAMRFPLIVLILYMHIVPIEHFPISTELTSTNAYNFIAEFVAHNVGRLAVPCFFLISGYFYFRKMERWSSDFYIHQQRKRLRTLVLPYLLWNILNILIILLKGYLFNLFGKDGSGDIGYIMGSSPWELMTYPVNQPLWYLRDLICMTFIAPLFYYLFKHMKGYGLIVLLGIYLSAMELHVRGFSMTAIFYFGTGALWGIQRRNFLTDFAPLKRVSIIIAPILAVAATLMHQSQYYENILRLFIPFGMIATFFAVQQLVSTAKPREALLKLSSSVFFIYAVHEIFLKNWVKGAFFRTPLADSGWGMIIGYIIMPIVLLCICLMIYMVMKRCTPKTLNVLTGGRQ